MKKREISYTGPLTGTLSEAKAKRSSYENDVEFSSEFEPIQSMWEVNPVEEVEYDGTLGYKDN